MAYSGSIRISITHTHRISQQVIAMKLTSVHRFSPTTVQCPPAPRAKPQRMQCVGTASTPTAVKMNQLEALKKVPSI